MALGHNDKYERGEEVRRKMRGEKKKKKSWEEGILQRFYKKKYFWPQFCDVVGSCANFFNLIFHFFWRIFFFDKGNLQYNILFSKYIFTKWKKKILHQKRKRKKKKPSEKGSGVERKKNHIFI
jgi:hypothetical protein